MAGRLHYPQVQLVQLVAVRVADMQVQQVQQVVDMQVVKAADMLAVQVQRQVVNTPAVAVHRCGDQATSYLLQ